MSQKAENDPRDRILSSVKWSSMSLIPSSALHTTHTDNLLYENVSQSQINELRWIVKQIRLQTNTERVFIEQINRDLC